MSHFAYTSLPSIHAAEALDFEGIVTLTRTNAHFSEITKPLEKDNYGESLIPERL